MAFIGHQSENPMICTELYDGQGLGNQLWCYAVTRTIAMDRSLDFGIMSMNKFKGKSFMKLDPGSHVHGGLGPEGGPPTSLPEGIDNYYRERKVSHPIVGCDISKLDPNLIPVQDRTKVDGTMQSEDYILHRKKEIINWFKPTPQVQVEVPDDVCVIHIRGGDFSHQHEVFLQPSYYINAVSHMTRKHGSLRFVCVTDHPELVRYMFPDLQIVGSTTTGIRDNDAASHHLGGPIEIDYTIMNRAKYLIIPNSSFSWWAAWTNDNVKDVIAPMYWARSNISDGYWSNGDSLVRGWNFLGKNGELKDYDSCKFEKDEFESLNSHFWR